MATRQGLISVQTSSQSQTCCRWVGVEVGVSRCGWRGRVMCGCGRPCAAACSSLHDTSDSRATGQQVCSCFAIAGGWRQPRGRHVGQVLHRLCLHAWHGPPDLRGHPHADTHGGIPVMVRLRGGAGACKLVGVGWLQPSGCSRQGGLVAGDCWSICMFPPTHPPTHLPLLACCACWLLRVCLCVAQKGRHRALGDLLC